VFGSVSIMQWTVAISAFYHARLRTCGSPVSRPLYGIGGPFSAALA
jgi:hypothetical protein